MLGNALIGYQETSKLREQTCCSKFVFEIGSNGLEVDTIKFIMTTLS